MWNNYKIISKGDYNYALVPDHPNATKNGYVLEHRIVMENYLGRLLNKEEVVHHKDGNRKNNKINNLKIYDNSTHARLHAKKGRTYVNLICPYCGIQFSRLKNKTYGSKRVFCTRRHAGLFYAQQRSRSSVE